MSKLFITCILALLINFKVNSLNFTSTSLLVSDENKNFNLSFFNHIADLEIELENERIVEVFKSKINDKIIQESDEKKYSQLKWYSYGSPKLIFTNGTFFHLSQTGFYILVQMLSTEHRQMITNEINEKFKILVKEKQILNIIGDEFVCSFELSCQKERKIYLGHVKDQRKLPLRVEFELANKTDDECLRNISKSLIIFSCNLTITSKPVEEMLPTLSCNFSPKFERSIDLIVNFTQREEENKSKCKKRCNPCCMSIDKTLRFHSNHAMSLTLLPNGFLASGHMDHILIWNVNNRSKIRTLTGHIGWIRSLSSLPSGHLASGSEDRTIILWNINNGSIARTLKGHKNVVVCLLVLNNENLASGSYDNKVIIWNYRDGSINKTLEGHSHYVTSLALLSNGNFASGSFDKTIKIWNANNFSLVKTLTSHKVSSLIVLSNGNLASSSEDKTINIWNIDDESLIRILRGHTDGVISLAVLPNGDLVSGSMDTTIKIWNEFDGSLLKTLNIHTDWIRSLVILENGNLASASTDRTINIWNTFCIG